MPLVGKVRTFDLVFPVDNERGRFRENDEKCSSLVLLVPTDDDYCEEVGQCAYANTFNRAFRGQSCRAVSL